MMFSVLFISFIFETTKGDVLGTDDKIGVLDCEEKESVIMGLRGCWSYQNVTDRDLRAAEEYLNDNENDFYGEILINATGGSMKKSIMDILDYKCVQTPLKISISFGVHVAASKTIRDVSSNLAATQDDKDSLISFILDHEEQTKQMVDNELNGEKNSELKFALQKILYKLDETKRKKSTENIIQLPGILEEISNLELEFQRNLAEVSKFHLFTPEEMRGIPEEMLEEIPMEDGLYKVFMNANNYSLVMKYAQSEKTRKQAYKSYQSRVKETNVPILHKLLILRDKAAKLMKYKDFASYTIKAETAKNPREVMKFLFELQLRVQEIWKKEEEEISRCKMKICSLVGEDCSPKLEIWDISYYQNVIKTKHHFPADSIIREYFLLPQVLEKMFEIFEDLFGLIFTKVDGVKWSEDVDLYRVAEEGSEKLLGYFYTDLYAREGKLRSGATFMLQSSCVLQNGDRMVSVMALLAGFSIPQQDMPTLLALKDVVTLFHEFGHVLHGLSCEEEFFISNSFNTELDFVEAPSQMMEYWVWDKNILKRISAHYKDGKPLPDKFIDDIIEMRSMFYGWSILEQINLSVLDIVIHTNTPKDENELFSLIVQDSTHLNLPEYTPFVSTFLHVGGDYGGKYYSYLWSQVFAADMFLSRFAKDGIMNKTTGVDYRHKVLSMCAQKDGISIVKGFLNREPNTKAFYSYMKTVSSFRKKKLYVGEPFFKSQI